MWVWLKYLADGQQDLWEQRVQGNQNAVITALRGRKSLRLDLYCEAEAEALRLVEEFGGAVRRLEDLDWVAESARSIPPLKIRDCLLVTSETAPARLQELQKSNKDRIVVMIPAEMAFGTGDHATTSSCLRFLADEARARQGGHWSMLDLGCGSGVLAIAARLLGADKCEAIDSDPNAVVVARRNVERNSASGVRISQSDLDDWIPENLHDVVMANLFATVLQRSFEKMAKTLREGGVLVVSGVLEDQWDDTREAAQAAGLAFEVVHQRGKWISAKGGAA